MQDLKANMLVLEYIKSKIDAELHFDTDRCNIVKDERIIVTFYNEGKDLSERQQLYYTAYKSSILDDYSDIIEEACSLMPNTKSVEESINIDSKKVFFMFKYILDDDDDYLYLLSKPDMYDYIDNTLLKLVHTKYYYEYENTKYVEIVMKASIPEGNFDLNTFTEIIDYAKFHSGFIISNYLIKNKHDLDIKQIGEIINE